MQNKERVWVLGASENPERYSHRAVQQLHAKGHEVVALGARKGWVDSIPILTDPADLPSDIDTVTLYINPQVQKNWYNTLLNSRIKRIIFNPGTENPELAQMATEKGIQTTEACTLVLLATDQF